jgi:hypothetical protein
MSSGKAVTLADIGRADQAGRPAFEVDCEAPVRRHAVAERFEVPGQGLSGGGVKDGLVIGVTVEPLASGRELQAPEQQVEAVGVLFAATSAPLRQ